jgi:hypothetical protein
VTEEGFEHACLAQPVEAFPNAVPFADPLEKLNSIIAWSLFEKPLAKALKRSDGRRVDGLLFLRS